MAKERRGLLDFTPDALADVEERADAPAAEMPVVPAPRRAGAVRDMAQSIQLLEKDSDEKERLEAMLRSGGTVVSLDPDLCDPSPIRDRLDFDCSDLIPSIRHRGQQVPILVRPHPTENGRYEIAFGNRRTQVCQGLGIDVLALVKEMTDEEMAIAQGQENTARQDLSYIEQARFVAKLKEKYATSIVVAAINTEETTVYKMLKIVGRIPDELIVLIGRAPKIGRPRWEKLSGALAGPDQVRAAMEAAGKAASKGKQSDARFEAAYEAVAERKQQAETEIQSESGRTIASRRTGAKGDSLVIKEEAFLEHLLRDLPRLYDEYLSSISGRREEAPPHREAA